MAIDRTGISSLQSGAPEIKYTGDEGPKSPDQQLMAQADPMLVEMYQQYVFEMQEQGMQPISFREFIQQAMQGMAYGGTAKPTYTQSRKQSLAYGGIAGLDGRKRYGIGSWFQEKIMDPIKKVIPNEIKDNPALTAAIIGGGANYMDLSPDILFGEGSTTEGWINNLLSNVASPRKIQDKAAITKAVPAGAENLIYGMPQGSPDQLNPFLGGSPMQMAKDAAKQVAGVIPDTSYTDRIMDIAKNRDLITNPTYGTFQDDQSLLSKAKDIGINTLKNVFLPSGPETGTGTGTGTGQGVNWKDPLKYGLMIGGAEALLPKAKLPTDTSGINIADIRRRALTGSDPDLHFLPPESATTAYAKGGRIGYDNGGLGSLDFVDKIYSDEARALAGHTDILKYGSSYAPTVLEDKLEAGKISQPRPGQEYITSTLQGANTELDRMEMQKQQLKERAAKEGLNFNDIFQMELAKRVKELGPATKKITEIDDRKRLLNLIEEKLQGGEYAQGGTFKSRTPIGKKKLSSYAQGGRIGAQEGGLMDLGGMEKDYRQEGGFVPIGGQERADDVPARLSKNEFVFTADAVRSAGGGDIDKGAEVMENVMEHLEQGGQVSEESQGLEGARNMFATAQRLEGVM